MRSKTSVPLPPKVCRANPNSTEISSTWSISPLANASTIVVGMMCMMNSVVVCILPRPVYCAIALGVERRRVDIHARSGSDHVDDDEPHDQRDRAEQSRNRAVQDPPVLPTFFMSSMPAMPTTTVQKMIGAIIILMSLIKPSPSGFIASPVPGRK